MPLSGSLRGKRARVALVMAEDIPLPSDIEDGEHTISDLFRGDDGVDEVVVESDKQGDTTQPEEILLAQTFKEAGIHLKAIKRLGDAASVRAALPTTALLADKFVWTTPRVRTLAVKCGFTPSSGAQGKAILK